MEMQTGPRRDSSSPASDRWARDRGFTMVELLVVVLIIGVLSAIAVPTYLSQRKKAVDASIKSDLKNAALIARQIADEGPYPAWRQEPDKGLPDGFNPGGWGTAGSQSTYGLFVFHDVRITGENHWSGWKGNRIHVGGLPAPGQWQLCGWNPGATKATDRTRAIGWDESQGGLVAEIDCTQGYWPAITPWFDGTGATSWWG